MNTGYNGFVGNGQDNLPNIVHHLFKGQLCTCIFLLFMYLMFSYMGLVARKPVFVLLKHKKCLTRMEASLLTQCIITEKQSNQISTLSWNKENGSPLTYS